jgi:TetR/AcrR family transcriptional repressor of lmrAB and yxaGH operons
MSDTRARILLTMARLIEKQGYHATGLNEIIRESGAPKGSLYYYFPRGKEQIGAEAILESGQIIAGRLHNLLDQHADPADAISNFLMRMADSVESTQFGAASPLTAASVETAVTVEPINLACRQAFGMILSAFQEKFVAGGFPEEQAAELAMYVTTVVEGGILMSRTYHQADPLRLAANHLHVYLRSL